MGHSNKPLKVIPKFCYLVPIPAGHKRCSLLPRCTSYCHICCFVWFIEACSLIKACVLNDNKTKWKSTFTAYSHNKVNRYSECTQSWAGNDRKIKEYCSHVEKTKNSSNQEIERSIIQLTTHSRMVSLASTRLSSNSSPSGSMLKLSLGQWQRTFQWCNRLPMLWQDL